MFENTLASLKVKGKLCSQDSQDMQAVNMFPSGGEEKDNPLLLPLLKVVFRQPATIGCQMAFANVLNCLQFGMM